MPKGTLSLKPFALTSEEITRSNQYRKNKDNSFPRTNWTSARPIPPQTQYRRKQWSA